jgi:hypothetical protein
MLEPEGRQLLLDALRPPAGYELDHAVGTTYSLDLMSVLAASLGFAQFDREASNGRLVANPVALVEAVRRCADRIDIFCQAGQIAVPREHRALFALVERSVHPVVSQNHAAIFHPKVWAVRYRHSSSGETTFRLLCLSRNLTFDQSWDTLLRLEGQAQARGTADRRLSDFIRRLPDLCVDSMNIDRLAAINGLAEDLRSVLFVPPDGFDRVAFWPLGLDPEVWPFEGRIDRLLVVSPFLTAGCLARLARQGSPNVIVSRAEAFDLLGSRALDQFADTLVMNPTALTPDLARVDDATAEVTPVVDEALAEQAGIELRGLHAKLYVADARSRTRIWTGSANATDAAFSGNVEFLVELEGPTQRCGVDSIVGERNDGVGVRKLLEPYRPANAEPRELTLGEQLERQLDELRRAIATLSFVATVVPANDDSYRVGLQISTPDAIAGWWEQLLGTAMVQCRPLSLGDAYLRQPTVESAAVTIDFGTVSFARLTSFFVIDMELRDGSARATATFVVNAQLVGAPGDRRERTLAALVDNARDLSRFLLLLLGQLGLEDVTEVVDLITGDRVKQTDGWLFSEWNALLEPMVRALAVDPTRLDEIDHLIRDLEATETGASLLPMGWQEVWEPIRQAREEMRTRA